MNSPPQNFRGLNTACSVLLVASVVCAAWAGSGTDVGVSGPTERMVIHLTLGDYDAKTMLIDGMPYQQLRLPGEPLIMEAGAPSVPRVSRALIVPDDARMSLRVLDAQYHELNAKLAPSKGSLPRSIDPATVAYYFGRAYETDAFYPGEVASLRRPHILRDRRGVVIDFLPFQYNPVRSVLRVYTQLTVEVAVAGHGVSNVLHRAPGLDRRSAAFEPIYRRHFLNHESPDRYDPLDEAGLLLIICHDPWLPYLQPFVAHKRAAGMDVTLVPAALVGSDADDIRAFVQQAYDTENLSFLLLVGDAEHVSPGWYFMDDALQASDPYYALLAGDDAYPDIMVGRFSADTAEHVRTQVERVIAYERLPATGQDWFWRGTGIGSDGGPGDDGELDWEHIENIRALLLDYGFTEVDQFYDPNEIDAKEVREALDAGRGIINFCGHGGPGGWGTSTFGFNVHDVESMLNSNRLPFIFSVACSTGDFTGGTCFGEALLRATHNGEPTGGIGFYGSSVGQFWSEPMEAQDEFNLLFVAEQYASYGALCYAGSCAMMDAYPEGGEPMFRTWHVFGDPSLRVVGNVPPPTGLGVEPYANLLAGGPWGGPFAPSSISYTLTNYEDTPIEYALACDAAWVDLGATGGLLASGEQVEVVCSINELAPDLEDGFHFAAVDFTTITAGSETTTRMIILEVNAVMPVQVFSLEQQLDWTMTGEWEFGQPTGGGGVEHGYPDPTSGATGPNVYGVNLNGDYSPDPGGPFHLTTTAIDCFDLADVSLRFQRWLNTDFRPYTFATVEVSDNGVNWTPVWENPGNQIVDRAWGQRVYDISAVADLKPEVFIRWGYETGSPAYPYSGWNLDDIEIWGRQAYATGLCVAPEGSFESSGALGGPFTPRSQVYALTNHTEVPIEFAVTPGAAWIDISPASGLIPLKGKVDVAVSINALAEDLPNGSFEAPVHFINATTHEGDTTRTVALDVDGPGLICVFDMAANPGWTMEGQWAFGPPRGQGGVEYGYPDPTSGATGLNVCGVNLDGDYSLEPGGPYHLTSGGIDCAGFDNVELRFQRWLNSDYQPYVHATLEVSTNGFEWAAIWDNGESEIADDQWSEQVYAISPIVRDSQAVYLRWGYQVNGAAYPYSGWNIDDVEIWGMRYFAHGDYDGDGDVDSDDFAALADCLTGPWELWGFSAPAAECLIAFDAAGDGDVDLPDFAVFQVQFGGARPGLDE